MNKIKLLLFHIRDFIARNFMVKPKALVYNNNIFFISIFHYFLLKILPFYIVQLFFNFFNISIIYELDSIYNITNLHKNIFLPIIFEFIPINNNETLNLVNVIKYYNSNIPLYFIMKQNNLSNCKEIKIKYMNNGKIINKIIQTDNFLKLPFYKVFEN